MYRNAVLFAVAMWGGSLAYAEEESNDAKVQVEQPAEVQVPAEKPQEERYGLLGPVRVGVSSSLEIPHISNYSVDTIWDRVLGASFSWGSFYHKASDVEAEIMNWDARIRWFPAKGSFFFGLMYGQQNLAAKVHDDLTLAFQDTELTVPTDIKVSVKTNYVTPHIGWFANWDWGLTLGFEIGYQMAMSAKADTLVVFENVAPAVEAEIKESSAYKDSADKVNSLAEKIGKANVPYVALFRIGFML